jgi:hypothetical protein
MPHCAPTHEFAQALRQLSLHHPDPDALISVLPRAVFLCND